MNVSRDRLILQLKTLVDLSSAVYTCHDPAEIRRRAVESAAILVDAERSSLLLCDPNTGELGFETLHEHPKGIVIEARLPKAEGIAGWVVENRIGALVNDVTADIRYLPSTNEFSAKRTRDMVCVPVLVHDEVVGALQAMNKVGGEFDEYDRDMMEALARHVSVAMENANLYAGIKEAFYQTAEVLADTLERADPSTGKHIRRVTDYSVMIAAELGLGAAETEEVRLVAILHDIGKIGVPSALLLKPGHLEDDELSLVKGHCETGYELLKKVARFSTIAQAVGSHHERFDGSGYPSGIAGQSIPLASRIVAVADAYDAMTSGRPYRDALSRESAMEELKSCSGTQFDPVVTTAFLELLERRTVSC